MKAKRVRYSSRVGLTLIIEIHFSEDAPPIVCRSAAEMDEALDRLDAETQERLRSGDLHQPLAITVVVPGYQVYTGLGADQSYVCVGVEPCDGEYYTAVGDEAATGESRMFYGSGQDSYWCPKNLLPAPVAREAVRHFVEHRRRSPEVRWQDWGERDV